MDERESVVGPSPQERTTKTLIDYSIVGLTCAVVVLMCGCRGKAQSDMYRQKMASEIRVLEDQLYDADYQNRVLRDQLERAEEQTRRIETPKPGAKPRPAPRLLPQADDIPDSPASGMGDDIEAPILDVDLGQTDPEPEPLVDPVTPDTDKPNTNGLVPPEIPEPPGIGDLELPEVIDGEPVPPPVGDGSDKPPGQIQLPDSLQAQVAPVPDKIRIHRGLSGAHKFEDEEQVGGLYLVVNAVDRRGKMIDLASFEIDAELTIVAHDPTLEGRVAQIGRWEFSPEEVAEFVRGDPSSGLHVPIRWQQEPATEEVVILVRLRSDEDEMRCEETLQVGTSAVMAKWTPRGEKLK